MEKKFLVTGASGWIGLGFLNQLKVKFGDDFKNRIIAVSSNKNDVGKNICLNQNFKFEETLKTVNYDYDFSKDFCYDIIHLGYPSKNIINEMGEKKFQDDCDLNRKFMVDFINNHQVSNLIFSSSGAIYNHQDLYAKNKIADENLLQNLAKEKKFNLFIARIFNIGGHFVKKPENFALYNFLLQAKNHKKIIIESKNDVYRSFAHLNNLAELFCNWLLDENKNSLEIIDICADKSIELKALAQKITKIFNLNCEIISPHYNEKTTTEFYVGNAKKYYDLMQKYHIKIHDLTKIIIDSNDYLNSLNYE